MLTPNTLRLFGRLDDLTLVAYTLIKEISELEQGKQREIKQYRNTPIKTLDLNRESMLY